MMAERKMPFAAALAALLLVASAQAVAKPPAHLVPFPEDQAEGARTKAQSVQTPAPKSDFRPRFRIPAINKKPADEPQALPQTALPQTAEGQHSALKQDPQVKPATHEEPTAAPQKLPDAQADEPQAAADAGPTKPVSPAQGREALDEAYAKSKVAETLDDYTEVIRLCRIAKAGGLSQKYEDYAHQLMGWAFNRRGEVHSKEGRDAEALDDFEAAVAAGGAWRAIHNRGVGYAAIGKLDEAMADLNRAIQLNPRYPHAYFNRAELRCKQGDYEGAVQDYTLAMKMGTRDAKAYSSRGHAYYRLEQFGDALRDYGAAIEREPDNADVLINRGDAYSDLGKYGLAAKDYRAAVRVAPKNARAFQAAAWLMATCPDLHYRDEKLAVDAAERAIELGGASFRNLSTLAAAQANAGQFEAAQETQEQAIAAAEKDQKVTAEKMMSLYRREIAYRDRPYTAFQTPEDVEDQGIRQATALEPIHGPRRSEPPTGERAWYQEPAPRGGIFRPQPAPQRGPAGGGQPKARLFAPRGRI